MIFGGGGNDMINAFASSGGTAALDGNNIVFGDHGLVDYLAEEQSNPATQTLRTDDIDRIQSIFTGMGGADTITVGNANDIVLGGFDNDHIYGNEGENIVFGDSGEIKAAASDAHPFNWSVHEFTVGEIASIAFTDGGNDTISTLSGRDIIVGGYGNDTITASDLSNPKVDDDNIVFGDDGLIDYVRAERETGRAGC